MSSRMDAVGVGVQNGNGHMGQAECRVTLRTVSFADAGNSEGLFRIRTALPSDPTIENPASCHGSPPLTPCLS